MSLERKTRVDSPERCIKTRGLAAAMQALREAGPHASLDRVAQIAGCPKASLARVFESKEELMLLALRELDRESMAALRETARLAGDGREGAFAAAARAAKLAADPGFRGCPLNAAAGSLAAFPWAQAIVREHKSNAIALFEELLSAEMPQRESLTRARAICLIADGVHITASAGMGPECEEAALMALSALILGR